MDIEWNESTFESHTKTTSMKIKGYACSNCGKFEQTKSRYCRDCGGRYFGAISKPISANDIIFGGF
jgi:rRNA maturation endonuclease Nob1